MSDQSGLFCALQAIRTEFDLVDFLRKLSRHFDFSGFLLFSIPAQTDDRLQPRVELSDLPAGMIERYDELGLLKNSQLFETLRRSTVPITMETLAWHDTRPSEEGQAAIRFFTSYNMTTAAFFPVHGSGGGRAVFGFLGDRDQLTHAETGEMGVLTAHAYSVYSNLKNASRDDGCGLTPREIEAVHWVANGKTSSEIASILSLSEHTVNTYINNAVRKLDCVNRTQLVAKALRLHLIC
ncbi:LuxR C-terminal-related transcriptional regulator [Hoeflea sp. AS16]|uniref:LuxR C-terminal-related transcriptional regulator n=1 Tax=Hoeflea sp. AS16 TaxID=3135779 RepID=UPI003177EA53